MCYEMKTTILKIVKHDDGTAVVHVQIRVRTAAAFGCLVSVLSYFAM